MSLLFVCNESAGQTIDLLLVLVWFKGSTISINAISMQARSENITIVPKHPDKQKITRFGIIEPKI